MGPHPWTATQSVLPSIHLCPFLQSMCRKIGERDSTDVSLQMTEERKQNSWASQQGTIVRVLVLAGTLATKVKNTHSSSSAENMLRRDNSAASITVLYEINYLTTIVSPPTVKERWIFHLIVYKYKSRVGTNHDIC